MAIGDDFSIAANGDIRHVSGTATYTVLQFHRWLQDLADNAQASGNDLLDITSVTPSERSTDNIITLNPPFNIDDDAAKYLYDGSITQDNGDTVYAGLVVVGSVEPGTQLQITQDETILPSYWGTGLNQDAAAGILLRIMVKVRVNGADIDGRRLLVWAREFGHTYSEFSVTCGLGNNTAAIFTTVDLNNDTPEATVATWSDITNTEGYQLVDITGDSIGEPYFAQWDRASRSTKQLYERVKWLQRRGSSSTLYTLNGQRFRGITHQVAFDTQTTNLTELAVLAWGTAFAYDGGTGTAPAVGQYWRNVTSGGVGKVVKATGSTTGHVVIQRETPGATTWADNDVLTLLGGTGSITINGAVDGNSNVGGAGVILALEDSGATGTAWIQLVSGAAPADNYALYQRGSSATDHGLVNGAPVTRTVPSVHLGTFTGSSIIGAYGVSMQPADTTASDQFFDLTNTLRQPPNNQTFTVFGLVAGEDRVLVGPATGGALNLSQLTLATSLSGAAETSVMVTTTIPSDTPSSGTIRVQLNSGIYRRLTYTSYSGSTFTIPATDFTSDPATAPKNVFISYIDKVASSTQESYTAVYSSDRSLFVRVRDGGTAGDGIPIKTFETTATFSSSGGSATAIRTSDA